MRPPHNHSSGDPRSPGLAPAVSEDSWRAASQQLDVTRVALAECPAGIVRQAAYDRLVAAQRRCSRLVHEWLSKAVELETVVEPTMVLSLDVDGVLEGEVDGFSSTGLAGAAALRLLQLGGVAVLLNTARSLDEVRERIEPLRLLGGVAEFGAGIWDGVFAAEETLLSERASSQLDRLRTALRADASIVLDPSHRRSIRASRIVDGRPGPIAGPDARRLLDEHSLADLMFWVAPRHTDFVDRSVDKGLGLGRLVGELRIDRLGIAAMGDASCDVPMLRRAAIALLPAGALPAYTAMRSQRLLRSHFLGEQGLWELACHLVTNVTLQSRVLATITGLRIPDWLGSRFQQRPTSNSRWLARLAEALHPHG